MLAQLKNREIGRTNNISLNFDTYKLENKLFEDDSNEDNSNEDDLTDSEEDVIYKVIMIYIIDEYIACLFSNFMVYILDEKTMNILYCINEIEKYEYITSIFFNEHLKDLIFVSKFEENNYLSVYKISHKNLAFNKKKLINYGDSYYINSSNSVKEELFNNCKIQESGYIEFDNYYNLSLINTQLFYFEIWSLSNYQKLYNINSYNRIYEIKVTCKHFILVKNKDMQNDHVSFWNITPSKYFYNLEFIDKNNLENVSSLSLPGSDNLSKTINDDINFIEFVEDLMYIKYINKNLLIYDQNNKKIIEIDNTLHLSKTNFIILPSCDRLLNINENNLILYNLAGIKLNTVNIPIRQFISFKYNFISVLDYNFIYLLNINTFELKKVNIDENILKKISHVYLEYPEIYIGTKSSNIYKFNYS